ncbi:MAG: Gfo/Idh/MocA family protein [Candidatus Bipolaricaulia bacterium]
MTEPLKWGILSTANIASKALVPALHETEVAQLTAVASRDEAKARQWADEHGIARAHGSYDALLDDAEIGAVYNPLPNHLHKEWTIKAADAGKHVLCEKPLGLNADECRDMIRACQRNDVVLMEAFMYRYHAQFRRLRGLVEDGAVGEPALVRASFSFPLASFDRPDNIRWQPDMGGGSLMDVGCYCVNVARALFDAEPIRAYARSFEHPDFPGVDAQLQGMLEFPDDRFALVDSSFRLNAQQTIEISGPDGLIRANGLFNPPIPNVYLEIAEGTDLRTETFDPRYRFHRQVEHFTACVREGRTPETDGAHAIGNMKTIEALSTSAQTGKPVEIAG